MDRQLFSLIAIGMLLLTACTPSVPVQPTDTLSPPTETPLPTSTSTPEPTFTPTVTPTPKLPVVLGTLMPAPGLTISADNLDQVVELARWGKGAITDAVYSPDGESIAIASTLGVSLYQADTLEEKSFFETTASITSLAFSPDGELVAAGLIDNTVAVWDVSDGALLKSLEHPKDEKARSDAEDVQVNTVAFSPDSALLASGLSDGTIHLWQVSDGKILLSPKKQGLGISGVFFSPDGTKIFSSSYDGTTYSKEVVDGKLAKTFSGKYIRTAALSADGKILATYDRRYFDKPGNIVVWDTESGKKLYTIETTPSYYGNDVSSLAISPDGQLLAAGFEDHTIKIWNATSGVLQNTLEDLRPNDGWYYLDSFSVAFSPDSQTVLLAGTGMLGIWDVKSGELSSQSVLKSDAYYAVSVSPDGQTLALVEGPTVFLRQIKDGSLMALGDTIQTNSSAVFSPDGKTIAVSLFDETARLWPLSDGGGRKTLELNKKGSVGAVAYSPDGQILALAGYSSSGIVELRGISDGSVIRSLTLSTVTAQHVEFSPNGEFVIVAGNSQILIFRASDGKMVKKLKGDDFAISPNGTLLAGFLEEDKTVSVWKILDGESVMTLKDNKYPAKSLAFSPDGTLLMLGLSDGTIQAVLVSAGTPLKSWKGHSWTVSDLAFTPDGKLLFTVSWDGTVRVWGIKP